MNTPLPESPASIQPTLQNEDNLIRRFQIDIADQGLVGESLNAVIAMLVALSAKLAKPLNLTVCGASSAGKNNLLDSVSAFLPGEMKKSLSGMTPKALMHMAEDEIEHKAIFIAEYEGVKGADYAIRTLQSEQFIEWEFVDNKNGIKKKCNHVRGPAAFLQATTRSVLHPENETRLLFIQIDESEEQTRAINERQAAHFVLGRRDAKEEVLAEWQDLIRSLEVTSVIIPFAKKVAPHFPSAQIRSRRDFPKLMGMIEVSAFLHQHRRDKQDGAIVANLDDYRNAKELFQHCYEVGPDRNLEQMLIIVKKIGGSDGLFTVAGIIADTGWGKSKTYELLKRAEELGCVVEGEQRGTTYS